MILISGVKGFFYHNCHCFLFRTFDSMKKLEEAVKRVNPDMDDDLIVVRHNNDKQVTLPLLC